MPLKDFVPEYRTLARFAGYLALAAAVAAPVYLSNKEYRRQIRDLREAVERLEDSRGTDQKNVREFLDRYVDVVEGMGKDAGNLGKDLTAVKETVSTLKKRLDVRKEYENLTLDQTIEVLIQFKGMAERHESELIRIEEKIGSIGK